MLIPESSSFEMLLNYFGFFDSLLCVSSCFSILWLRYKRPEAVRPYKVTVMKQRILPGRGTSYEKVGDACWNI